MFFVKCIPGRILGMGGTSQVYELRGTNGQLVAKIEKIEKPAAKARIIHEYKIYCVLEGVPVVPKVRCLIQLEDRYVLIMENAGTSLPNYLRKCDPLRSTTLRQTSVARHASEMISALRIIHSKGVIHGDIHPDNFMIEETDSDVTLRLIDFGAATEAGRPRTDFKNGWEINFCFASLERTSSPCDGPSIADDLVALGYTLIYLVDGHLPWEDLVDSSGNPTDASILLNTKRLCNANTLCKGLPSVFYDFLAFVLKLTNSAVPQNAEYETHSRAFWDFAQRKAAKTE